ncbi:hypothetical protein G2W53_032646 [Senna tora]|uniref:Uncharacterized protein n=1 Tax=Senna tora TaxID=362788 RepID=A0A834W6H4_9FABA|nr:hypothetical protein G2W53_032646 [Senna tora]
MTSLSGISSNICSATYICPSLSKAAIIEFQVTTSLYKTSSSNIRLEHSTLEQTQYRAMESYGDFPLARHRIVLLKAKTLGKLMLLSQPLTTAIQPPPVSSAPSQHHPRDTVHHSITLCTAREHCTPLPMTLYRLATLALHQHITIATLAPSTPLYKPQLDRGCGLVFFSDLSLFTTASTPMAAPKDLPATAASSSSNEDPGVVEPWVICRHAPESCSSDLSWLDSSVFIHKSTLCCVGRNRSLWESYFAPYENFLRATSDDASLSLEHGFIMPQFSDFEVGVLDYLECPPSMLSPNCWLHMGGFQAICARLEARPLGRDRLITELQDSLRNWREEFFFVVPRGGERLPWWFTADGVLRFPCGWVVPHEAHPQPELDEMSPASVETLSPLEGKTYCYYDLVAHDGGFRFIPGRTPRVRSSDGQSSSQPRPPVRPSSTHSSASRWGPGDARDPDFRVGGKQSTDPPQSSVVLRSRGPLPFESSDPAGKRKVCSVVDATAEKSGKKGKTVQTCGDLVKERRTFSDRPGFAEFVGGFLPPPSLDKSRLSGLVGARSHVSIPPYPEVGPIHRAATEDSLFNNRYDATAAVREKFSCSPDREAMENFVYSYGLRSFRDVITRDPLRALYYQSFYCEFSNSFDEYENAWESRNAKAVERVKEVMVSRGR